MQYKILCVRKICIYVWFLTKIMLYTQVFLVKYAFLPYFWSIWPHSFDRVMNKFGIHNHYMNETCNFCQMYQIEICMRHWNQSTFMSVLTLLTFSYQFLLFWFWNSSGHGHLTNYMLAESGKINLNLEKSGRFWYMHKIELICKAPDD